MISRFPEEGRHFANGPWFYHTKVGTSSKKWCVNIENLLEYPQD